MNRLEHKGLDLIGIIILYIGSFLYIAMLLIIRIESGYLDTPEAIFLIFSITSLVLTILYHTNQIKSYILIGIIGLYSGFIIGGVLILIGNNKQKDNLSVDKDELSVMESKLKQLDSMLSRGVISKEEYETKRKNILDKF